MKMNHSILVLFFVLVSVSILMAGCGTFEVGIETISPPTPFPVDDPTEVPTEIVLPSPTIEPVLPTDVGPLNVPDLVSIGHLAPFASAEMGLLVLESGELTAQPSPVELSILWDYSPLSGKLAYSSEFFHTSASKNLAVSDLWVYDYQTETAQRWLEDNVTRAAWAPDGEHITAAVYNPDSEQIDLVLVSGPDQVEVIAKCASTLFSWSPTGDKLAYINALLWINLGVDESCLGTYLVSFPNGISGGEWEVTRVSDFSGQEFGGSHVGDQPLWALEQNALIYPDSPFWVVPLDGSPAFIPQTPGDENPMNLPRTFGSLWAPQLNQLVGNVDQGPGGGFGGVWVYQLSEDLSRIENLSRIGDVPQSDNSFINLVDWWQPGESLLVLDGDNPDTSQYLSEFWRGPAVWSLIENQWLEVFNQ